MKCDRDTIKFEVEILAIAGYDNLFLVKFTKLAGDTAKYNELCSNLYKQLDI
jgi:Kinase associated domain 1.